MIKKTCLTLLAATALVRAICAQEFTETFSTGAPPVGWTLDPIFGSGNRDFANGRANVYPTDAAMRLLRPLAVPVSVAKVTVRFDGNLAASGVGETNWLEARTTAGDTYIIHHGFGDWTRPSGFNAGALVEFFNQNNPGGTYAVLADQRFAKVFGDYSYEITFEDGGFSEKIYSNGSLFAQQVVSVPALRVRDIDLVGFGLYTTTEASIWVDNFSISFDSVAPVAFTDPFDSLDSARWEIVGGNWSVDAGQLTGSWPTGFAQTDQGNLLLISQDSSADFDAYFQAVLGNGATGFSLYHSAGNKYNVNVGSSIVGVERRTNGGDYVGVVNGNFTPVASGASVVRLSRRGAVFSVSVNGVAVTQFTDNVWSGALRLGLRAYNTAVYDAFSLNQPLGSTDADCAVLQQALSDALAALAAANTQVTQLQQQLAAREAQIASLQAALTQADMDKTALQASLAQALADKALLQQQLTAAQTALAAAYARIDTLETSLAHSTAANVTLQAQNALLQQQLAAAQAQIAALQASSNATAASLSRLEVDFRSEFSDPGFVMPGATNGEKVSKLADAVIGLNHGRKQAVYNSLK